MEEYDNYNDSDDYMEKVLSLSKYDKESDKYNVRKAFRDFFPERGCLFFVRPVHEEDKLQRIETLDRDTLRPEFLEALEEFKVRISETLEPKTYGGVTLDGKGFLAMVEEIVESFNSHKTPQILGVIEQIRETERRGRTTELQGWVDDFLHENPGREDLVEAGVRELYGLTLGREKSDLDLERDLYKEALDYFMREREAKKDYESVIRTKLLSKALENARVAHPESGGSDLANVILSDPSVSAKRFLLGESFENVFHKLMTLDSLENKREADRLREEAREQALDLEHQAEKVKLAEQQMSQWKMAYESEEGEVSLMKEKLRLKEQELNTLRDARGGDNDLVIQLELLSEKNKELEKENNLLRSQKGGGGGMGTGMVGLEGANVQDMLASLEAGGLSEDLQMMIQGLGEEVIEDNKALRAQVETLEEENDSLKSQNTDIIRMKDEKIRK